MAEEHILREPPPILESPLLGMVRDLQDRARGHQGGRLFSREETHGDDKAFSENKRETPRAGKSEKQTIPEFQAGNSKYTFSVNASSLKEGCQDQLRAWPIALLLKEVLAWSLWPPVYLQNAHHFHS